MLTHSQNAFYKAPIEVINKVIDNLMVVEAYSTPTRIININRTDNEHIIVVPYKCELLKEVKIDIILSVTPDGTRVQYDISGIQTGGLLYQAMDQLRDRAKSVKFYIEARTGNGPITTVPECLLVSEIVRQTPTLNSETMKSPTDKELRGKTMVKTKAEQLEEKLRQLEDRIKQPYTLGIEPPAV